MIWRLWLSARQLLLPAHCAACGAPAPPELRTPVCGLCGEALAALIARDFCPRCGRTTGPHAHDADGCANCRGQAVPYDAVVRVGPYEEPLRRLILRYKYERRVEMAHVLGRLLAERLALAPWADLVDLIVPVPLHWTRLVRRGVNQSDMMARELTAAGGRRVAGRRLLRVRPTPHQTRLSAADRAKNVRGAFDVRRRAADLAGRRILLVDDVMTSGATVSECARTLKEAGAAAVFVAVLATADHHDPASW
jgi:ComF family protein